MDLLILRWQQVKNSKQRNMKQKTHLSIFLVVFLVFGNTAYAQQTVAQKTDKMLQALLHSANLPGISVAISHKGKLRYARAFGDADIKRQEKLTPEHSIRTASVAKVLTATALGKLATDGKIDFDVPISQYISYINPMYANLTIRQLAAHVSGMPHRPSGNFYKKQNFTEIRPTVELVNSPLNFTPGSQYQYSTHAFNLLAAVIEGVTGSPYSQWMETNFFTPLAMHHTAPEDLNKLTSSDATGYYLHKGKLKPEKVTSASYKLAGAGFRSTPSDLVKLTDAFTNGMLSDEVTRQMTLSNKLTNGTHTQVGIGWRISYDFAGRRTIEHAGSWRGARTVVVYYPEEQLAVAIMINATCQIFIEETAHLIASSFLSSDNHVSSDQNITQKVSVSINSNSGPQQKEGVFTWQEGSGQLDVADDTFIRSGEVFPVGNSEGYALVTTYGLMYLDLSYSKEISGKVYLYDTRNEEPPTKRPPFISITQSN
ncbi:MAG: serine hydrolase domain-containing protein [Bacteroidota bacterium]